MGKNHIVCHFIPHMMLPSLREDSYPVIIDFISQKVSEAKAEGVVVGLSGGIDSAVTSKLCADAIGPENVLNIHMPYGSSLSEDEEACVQFSEKFGMDFKVVDISDAVDSMSEMLPSFNRKDLKGNVIARCRMIVLFHHAKLLNRVVMGTGNKSELLIGYFTKFGDGAADFEPIGDLYKTEVRQLAREIGVPDDFISKVCTAGLWEGQTDEAEIGVCYEDLDKILYGLELGLSDEEIADRTGIHIKDIKMIRKKHRSTVHKRKMPLVPKIGVRTLGLDWRE